MADGPVDRGVDPSAQSRDYPYYTGWPVAISGTRWIVPLAGVALGAAILIGQPAIFTSGLLRLAPSLLFALLPLLGLALVAGRHWRALFRKVHLRDAGWMLAFAALNYAIAVPLGFLTMEFIDVERNAGIAGMAASTSADKVLFFLNSIPQLIGEELISIIPFLAILCVLTRKFGVSKRSSVIVAWLATAIWFAGLHLPAYNGNILQCLILIGGARLVLTLAYMKTKNVWVSAGAHIINDWTTFTIVLIGTASGGQ